MVSGIMSFIVKTYHSLFTRMTRTEVPAYSIIFAVLDRFNSTFHEIKNNQSKTKK